MSTTLALVGSVLDQRGHLVLAAAGDLEATGSADITAQLAVFSTLAGILTPFAIAFINRPTFSPLVRALVTIAVCAGIGALTAAGEGKLNGVRLSVAALTVLGTAIGTYKLLLPQPVQAFELATTPAHARTGRPPA